MQGWKKGASLILALTTAFGLTACGSSGNNNDSNAAAAGNASEPAEASASAELPALDPANPTKVTFYSYSLAYPTMKAGMEELLNEFNETVGKEKGVIVEGIADTTLTQWKTDIQAGKQVDIVQHGFATMDSSRQTLGFKAFEDVFPKDELESHLQGISPNAQALGKIDGKMYGLAFTFSTPILFMNGKLFQDAGLDPNNPPKTWDDVKAAALQIKEKTGKDGFGLAPNNGWTTEGVILSNGGKVIADDRKSAEFASDEGIEAIQMWKDLYHSGAHAVGTDSEVTEQFMAGNLGMFLQSTSVYSGIKSASEAAGWQVYGAQMPQFGDKPSVPVNSGSMLAVRPDSDIKAAAIWEFVKFVTGDRGYTIITSKVGYLPLRTALADDPNGLKDFVDQNPLYRVNLAQLDRIQPVAIWPGEYATEIATAFTDAIVKAVSTDADVRETLTQAQDQINDMLQQ
ncbi:ABC transporter substrate-binding protein [Cohnella thailandensis]|uniref:ABC transporter substrate-binding protein n=1 Tax=Cohnella thailandensis TaxID=557557 RepID=A0A841SWM8_9BACL|nr:ABC transporter substrate-binding protein [Cohnella thailandensis]MBB6633141.1 ABC transporter substrate-binding protein [Cohnella thailandensis]MBP1975163.1 multiple sugar transport system substrate-binding protein [Cohnella thailandensis]